MRVYKISIKCEGIKKDFKKGFRLYGRLTRLLCPKNNTGMVTAECLLVIFELPDYKLQLVDAPYGNHSRVYLLKSAYG
jgi:hypothetical protein